MSVLDLIDIKDYGVGRLVVWTIADLSAVLWMVSALTDFDVGDALGSSSEVVLTLIGVIGLISLVLTWTEIGPEVR